MLFRNVTLPDDRVCDVRVAGETIEAVDEHLSAMDAEGTIDATGLRVFPGAIDVHVHLRQPGQSHKETWATGTAAAAAGGVTTVVDQPNTRPPTISGKTFDQKADLATEAIVDYGINGGVSPDWDPSSLFERPLFALGEVFLADSTGDMGIKQELFVDAVNRAADAGLPVTVHAEDATRFDASARAREDPAAWSAFRPAEAERAAVELAVDVGSEYDVSMHIAHASTPEGVDAAVSGGLTTEVTPHHLFLSINDLDDLGTLGRMNPPLRDEQRREAMWRRLVDGTIDIVATDHAPHTRAEKDASIWDAPSGVPGVETMLPLLLAAARRGALSYERIAEVTARNPASRFGLDRKGRIEPGFDADLVLVDPDAVESIQGDTLVTACGWTPFEDWDGVFPLMTLVRGAVVYEDGRVGRTQGQNVRVQDA